MERFTRLDAIAVPIDIVNCDTDQIIPARFLRFLPEDGGFERFLLHDLRFDEQGRERGDFVLNQAPYRHGKIIVADANWGCGSSREHAVHALVAYGVRCVIAPSFGDIHYGNCTKNGVLPVRLPAEVCDELRAALRERPGARISVDLEEQAVRGPGNRVHRFEIDPFDRYRLLNGLDELGLTLESADAVSAYEAEHFAEYDWLPR